MKCIIVSTFKCENIAIVDKAFTYVEENQELLGVRSFNWPDVRGVKFDILLSCTLNYDSFI